MPGEGVTPDDSGEVAIEGLGELFTANGYDVYLYGDADRNNRTFQVTVDGQTLTIVDNQTYSGAFSEGGSGVNENYVVFRGLTAERFTIVMDSSTGRGAVNAIQIIASDAKRFIRGDCNGDGETGGVADALYMLTRNFIDKQGNPAGGEDGDCEAACDADGNGRHGRCGRRARAPQQQLHQPAGYPGPVPRLRSTEGPGGQLRQDDERVRAVGAGSSDWTVGFQARHLWILRFERSMPRWRARKPTVRKN